MSLSEPESLLIAEKAGPYEHLRAPLEPDPQVPLQQRVFGALFVPVQPEEGVAPEAKQQRVTVVPPYAAQLLLQH